MKRDQKRGSFGLALSPLRTVLDVVEEWSPSDRARDLLVGRAHVMMDRLERVSDTMQKVADLQLEVMERLRPIVDDLGELVKLSLVEARGRTGAGPVSEASIVDDPPSEEVVDVESWVIDSASKK